MEKAAILAVLLSFDKLRGEGRCRLELAAFLRCLERGDQSPGHAAVVLEESFNLPLPILVASVEALSIQHLVDQEIGVATTRCEKFVRIKGQGALRKRGQHPAVPPCQNLLVTPRPDPPRAHLIELTASILS